MENTQTPAAVFYISCAREDQEVAIMIADILSEAGHEVILDKKEWRHRQLRVHHTWEAHHKKMLRDMLDAGTRVIALYSATYFESKFCRYEAEFALAHDRLIPIRISESKISGALANIQYYDLVPELVLHDGLVRLSNTDSEHKLFDFVQKTSTRMLKAEARRKIDSNREAPAAQEYSTTSTLEFGQLLTGYRHSFAPIEAIGLTGGGGGPAHVAGADPGSLNPAAQEHETYKIARWSGRTNRMRGINRELTKYAMRKKSGWVGPFLAIAAATAAAYVLTKNLFGVTETIKNLIPEFFKGMALGAVTVGSVRPVAKGRDQVSCSVFAPATGRPNQPVMVQVFLHIPMDAATVTSLATLADPQTGFKARKCLLERIARGDLVEITLEGRGLIVDEPVQSIVWSGVAEACNFEVKFPVDCNGSDFMPRVHLRVGGVELGQILFKLSCDQASEQAKAEPQGDKAIRYKEAFFSYSSHDRVKVLEAAELYQKAGITVFQDILELEDTERYGPKIFEAIDACDLFLLFWSHNAKQSEWVLKETRHALARREKEEMPDIKIQAIDPAHMPPPPTDLGDYHFDSRMRLIRLGAETEAEGRHNEGRNG